MKYILIFLFSLVYIELGASIYCPPNKSLFCNDDIHYLYLTGKATAIGYPPSMVKYSDISFQDQCKVGYINRIWYIDLNNDGIYQSTESSCTQVLTISYIPSTVTVSFPANKEYTCKEEIVNDKPTWVSGPCDVMGYNVEDAIFEVTPDACYKIFRKFTVLNWCKYKPTNPNWDGSGIWTYTQVIKVIEKTPPSIQDCTNKVIGVEVDCKTSITLKNKAFDDVLCQSELLSWIVEIDLWGDGTTDYKYGFNETGEFLIKPVKNGTEISFTLPERVGIGKHKIYWSVRDQCGNFKTCNTLIETKDLKKPTPYINVFMTSAFQANFMNLDVPARWFNVNSSDNCTPAYKLRYSFSPNVNDTIRTINCTNAGFQFFNIYVTDLAGNSDFAEAFMLVFDNGSCNPIGNFTGTVAETNGKPMENVDLTLYKNEEIKSVAKSNPTGNFAYLNSSLYEGMSILPNYFVNESSRLNIADFKKLQNYILGRDKLINFEYFAADLTGDAKVRIDDLVLLREKILGISQDNVTWKFISNCDTITSVNGLANLKSQFDIIDWRGKIGFKAVYNGDIMGANHETVAPRNKVLLNKVVEDGKVLFFVDADIRSHGLQLEFDVESNDFEELEIQSNYFKTKGSHVVKDFKNGKLRILISDEMDLNSNDAIIELTRKDGADLKAIKIEKSFLLSESYQLNILQDQTQDKYSIEIQIQPNPNGGLFQVKGSFDKIVSIVNSIGQNIVIDQRQDHFFYINQPGIYYVSFLFGQKIITKKVIILK